MIPNMRKERQEFAENRKGVSFLNREIRFKEILKYKRTGKLLDIGCALGFFLSFAEKNFETYGIDISPLAIKKAKEIVKKSKLSVCNAQDKYPFQNDFFDIVVSFDVIEHLENPKQSVDEAFRVLKSGGYLFLQTPTDKSQKILPDKTHINLFSKKELIYILEQAGFKITLFQRRRSILYFNRFLDMFNKLFFGRKREKSIDSFEDISKGNSKLNKLRKLKKIIHKTDLFLSKFLPAPEMYVVAQKI